MSGHLGTLYKRRDLDATEHPTTTDIILAAGWYEGEGHCRYFDTEAATITQQDLWILRRLKNKFGGSVSKLNGPNKSGSYCHHWRVCGTRARGFLMTIYQFLSPWRKAQIRRALRVLP